MSVKTSPTSTRVAYRPVRDRGGLKAQVILWDCRHFDGYARPTDYKVEHSPTGHYVTFLDLAEARAALNHAAFDPAQVIPALRDGPYDAKMRESVPEVPE